MKQSLGSMASVVAVPLPVWIVGTYGSDGAPNLITVSWGGICCSEPLCVSISLRKSRLSHQNIILKQAFTINIPNEQQLIGTDFVGLVSGNTVDKFSMTKWTPVQSQLVNAPYIDEVPLVFECQVLQSIEIGSHTQFIAKIVDVLAEAKILGEAGVPQVEKLAPICASPGDQSYYSLGNKLGKTYVLGKKLLAETTK